MCTLFAMVPCLIYICFASDQLVASGMQVLDGKTTGAVHGANFNRINTSTTRKRLEWGATGGGGGQSEGAVKSPEQLQLNRQVEAGTGQLDDNPMCLCIDYRSEVHNFQLHTGGAR